MESLTKKMKNNSKEILGLQATIKINELKELRTKDWLETLRLETQHLRKILKRYIKENEKITKQLDGEKRVEK